MAAARSPLAIACAVAVVVVVAVVVMAAAAAEASTNWPYLSRSLEARTANAVRATKASGTLCAAGVRSKRATMPLRAISRRGNIFQTQGKLVHLFPWPEDPVPSDSGSETCSRSCLMRLSDRMMKRNIPAIWWTHTMLPAGQVHLDATIAATLSSRASLSYRGGTFIYIYILDFI